MTYLQYVVTWRARARGRPLPPGPRGYPVIGNLLNIPPWKPWVGFRDLSTKFGNIVYLDILGKPMVVLSSPEVVTEFLGRCASNSSDRVESALVHVSGQAFNFGLMRYGERWRSHRRMFWQHFSPDKIVNYRPVQRATTYTFLNKVLSNPANWKRLAQYVVTASTMKLTYDINVNDEDDIWVDIVDDAVVGLRVVTVTAQFLLQHFPFVRHVPSWFPGAGFHRELASTRRSSEFMLEVPFSQAKTQGSQGSKCIVAKLLQRITESCEAGAQEANGNIARNVASVMVQGGSDTTFSSIQALFLGLSLNIDAQKKAQAELATVVGPNRLPDFDDRDALIYVNAIIKEGLRWHTMLPLGVAHRTAEDSELQGYFIPAGTVITPNTWAVMRDPNIYPEPERFIPERFIRDGKLDPDILDPAKFVFGFGRRICPGRHFADSTLFITIACTLHVFDIRPPLDKDGRPIRIELEQSHGFLSYPEDCRCTVIPRSAEAEALIRISVEGL
ncbi:cytochrome P450 [Cubamyces lactineus]|nr:cytochrome P450 [Cubamyces lactineus]